MKIQITRRSGDILQRELLDGRTQALQRIARLLRLAEETPEIVTTFNIRMCGEEEDVEDTIDGIDWL